MKLFYLSITNDDKPTNDIIFFVDCYSFLLVTEPNFAYLLRDSILGFGDDLDELKVADSLFIQFENSTYPVKRQKSLYYGPNKADHVIPFFKWDRDKSDKLLSSCSYNVGDIEGFGYVSPDSIHHIYIIQVQNW